MTEKLRETNLGEHSFIYSHYLPSLQSQLAVAVKENILIVHFGF